jgi:hypothetical protein
VGDNLAMGRGNLQALSEYAGSRSEETEMSGLELLSWFAVLVNAWIVYLLFLNLRGR